MRINPYADLACGLFLLLALVAAMAVAILPGCVTTTDVDGTVTIQLDTDIAVPLAEAALKEAREALAAWMAREGAQDALWRTEKERRQKLVNAALDALRTITRGEER